MSGFKDHFSANPAGYADYRPRYPRPCSTGSPQCAAHDWFGTAPPAAARRRWPGGAFPARVIGSDASAAQIEHAQAHPGVDYRVAPPRRAGRPAASVDPLTVAQAAHWFDLDAFCGEVRRVLKPGGVIALWGYESCAWSRRWRVSSAGSTTMSWTVSGRRSVSWWSRATATLAFPFATVDPP
ncbi:MAG: class I SAM-dependent methyltransferase [Betaproteobacteria bacterium]|nr:class I SAM-dependent methyltransferase [Betaproteobacteria bacterium]